MQTYTQPADIPPGLSSKTGLRLYGLKLAPGQKPVAILSGPAGKTYLYQRAQAIPGQRHKSSLRPLKA